MKATGQRQKKSFGVLWVALALISVVLGATGCGTLGEEPENVSSRPWNSPEGYQNGNLPANMFH